MNYSSLIVVEQKTKTSEKNKWYYKILQFEVLFYFFQYVQSNIFPLADQVPHPQLSSPLLTRSPGFRVKPPLSGCPLPGFPRIPTHTVYPRLFCRLMLRPAASPATDKITNSRVTAILIGSSRRRNVAAADGYACVNILAMYKEGGRGSCALFKFVCT
jgi:hypothetical protein